MKNRIEQQNHSIVKAVIILLVCSELLLLSARRIPGFAQWYTVTVYPALQGSLGRFSGLFPFSLAEMLCAALPLVLVADIILCIRNVCHGLSSVSAEILRFLRHILLLASVLFFLYSANCGVNYYSEPFVAPADYTEATFTIEDLESFCDYTIEHLSKCYDNSGESSSVPAYPEGKALADEAVTAMYNISDQYPVLKGFYPIPKQLTFMSRLFSKMGVSGIYSPFTIEANVNGEMMGLEKPFTSCHELSHLRGYMNEGEANYIGWLACIGSNEPSFRRSGWLIAWIYAGNSLRRIDPELYASLYERLPEQAVAELKENSKFWAEKETKASEIQDRVNDAYLKSNGQENGIQTYGQLTTLMLMWFRNTGSNNIELN